MVLPFVETQTSGGEDAPPFDFYEFVGYWGLDVNVALNLTPSEAFRYVKGEQQRLLDEQNRLITHAYLVATLMRSSNLPSLDSLLIKPQQKKRADKEELKRLVEEFGALAKVVG